MSLSQQKLGFHYYPDTDHYSPSDLDAWLPVLKSAGASWLTVRAQATSNIPESFIRALIAADIQPIVHIPVAVGSLRMAHVYTALKSYADWGVRYVIFYDRPNVRASWPTASWAHEALVDDFVDALVPVLEAQNELGITPVFPALEPGGDYWDTAFFERALTLTMQRASSEVMDKLTLAIYMWSFGRSLDWGQGGNTAWPEARPYATPTGSQDQCGFQVNDWYQEIAEKVTGRKLPVLVLAGGAGPTNVYDTPEAIQLGNNEVARHLAQHGLDEGILNFCFYPLATAEGHADFQAAWYVDSRPVRPSKTAEVVSMSSTPKDIEHYVLLGLSNQTNGLRLWNAIAPLALSARPTIGFSLEEAKRAARVSLVGDLKSLPVTIEAELSACGSEYERFEDWDTDNFLLAAADWAAKTTVTGVDHD
ncbi:MAG: hypothetical protein E4G99_11105 [Anaerolineales bacterium]|nr:MAG: hypothetical protein E4G99_11105 [Anaerolineales bacterium]